MKIRWRTETRRETHEVTTIRIKHPDGETHCRNCGELAVNPTAEHLTSLLRVSASEICRQPLEDIDDIGGNTSR